MSPAARPLPIVWHPDYIASLRPNHPFPMSKYHYLRLALEARGMMGPGEWFAPAALPALRIAAAHEIGYVDRVIGCTLSAEETRRIGLPSTPAVARRATLSSAGTLLAARLAMEHGLAVNAAGGSHHAGPDYGSGYCVFNDVAVAARALLDEGLAARILVVDCDVHQGDGTAWIFENDPRVFTFSIHAQKNFPARKAVSDLDVGLMDGLGDADYLATLADALAQALERSAPDFVFYNAGVDPWEGDRLGRLALSFDGLRRRDRLVLETIRARGLPVAAALGGGYSRDPDELAGRHAILFEEAAALTGTGAAG
ncbi:Acetoin utilization deacetylase AcuC [Albimonas donghaensis]|uniref:Acetoin utilization deacetylase AcuC n=1 Tax=Albimonas donghaensis TaxID=356660 RepID=A0A1H2RHP0_9RHOB|nr:histone deacetylase [Albimonas donghaensis]SDW18815.1 Acetoin utilization deacetylase AcuC [Albimonas donghaensis]